MCGVWLGGAGSPTKLYAHTGIGTHFHCDIPWVSPTWTGELTRMLQDQGL